ncbi:MAG: FHA domain-containing protein [Kiritimatiellae bacterium]|nr:FHA domain-containing protein [Kiritimatiellia bacterium]
MATLLLYPGTDRETHALLSETAATRVGRASDSEIRLQSESVSTHHARIERKPDGWYVVDLGSTNGTTLNDAVISISRLNHDDRIEFGDVPARFLLSEQEQAEQGGVEPIAVSVQPDQPVALAPIQRGAMLCARCQAPLGPGMQVCPYCGAPVSVLPGFPMDYVPPVQPAGRAGPGILPIIALLAALTVIGFPVAIVLGLMSLSAIRRRGGTIRDRNMAGWSVGLGVLWMMVLLGTIGLILRLRHAKEQVEFSRGAVQQNEDRVVASLRGLARAQKFARTIEFVDGDRDGNGEYLALPQLADCGSHFFDSDLADGQAYGYRFAMKEVSEGNFVATAEPLVYGETGVRAFSIDATGQVRGKDTEGKRLNEVSYALPALNNERNAFYEMDDEIADDVINFVKALGQDVGAQERKSRILDRLRTAYALTRVGQELQGITASVDRDLSEYRAERIYAEAQQDLREQRTDAALAKLNEIAEKHAAFSKIAEVKRQIAEIGSVIAEENERKAKELFDSAEQLERDGRREEAHRLYQKIERHYPGTDVAKRIVDLKPELQRLLREKNAEEIFVEMMELSPERDFQTILNLSAQLRRNYQDTELYGKNEPSVGKKERKARAGKWRQETLEDMRAGRSRGALARLEAAAKESPDLIYDLRDVFVNLYRTVAQKLVEERDSREALRLYTELQKLLQGSESAREIPPELIAQLHNDVGQSDFEKGEYSSARWHLSNAAWRFAEDPPFNLRLGISELYMGQYEPALAALTRAVNKVPEMDQGLLYRAYLNLRYVLFQEDVVAEALSVPGPGPQSAGDAGETGAADSAGGQGGADSAAPAASPGTAAGGGEALAAFEPPDYSGRKAGLVPEPKDAGTRLKYNYQTSSRLLPDIVGLIRRLHDAKVSFKQEVDKARGKGRGAADDARMRQYVKITEFRNEISGFRTATVDDGAARRQLIEMMQDMERRLQQVIADLAAAKKVRKELDAVLVRVIGQVEQKRQRLSEGVLLLANNMQREIDMQKKAFALAETLLGQVQLETRSGLDVPRLLRDLVQRSGDRQQLDRGLISLRKSIEAEVDIDDIFQAADGGARVGAALP